MLREIIAANHVKNDIHAFASGPLQRAGDPIVFVVIEGALAAQLQQEPALFRRSRRGRNGCPECPGSLDRKRSDSARAALHQEAFACNKPMRIKQIGPRCEGRFRQRGCRHRPHAFRNPQAAATVRHAILGISAARHQRANSVCDLPALLGARSPRHNFSGDFQA